MEDKIDASFKYLLFSRVTRSFGLVYTGLAFSLYLSALKLSVPLIGLAAGFVIFASVLLSLLYGMVGDRKGFKAELVMAEGITFFGSFLIAVSTNVYLIIAGMMLAGFSGTAGGLRGTFTPGINAFIANNYREEKERVRKYSLTSLTAAIAAIGGGIMFSLVGPLARKVGLLLAYRYLFAASAFFIGLSFVFLLFLKEREKEKKKTKIMNKASWHYTSKVITVNALGGVGMGLMAPLLPLWFKLNYHVGTLAIGSLFTLTYIATAVGLYLSLRYAHKFESLTIAYATRIIQSLLVLALALSPFFLLTALIYFIRSVFSGFGSPSRTNVNIRGVSNEDYGTASSIQGIATRLAQLSSSASGYLMEIYLPLPLLVGGLFQLASGIGYKALFKRREEANK